jgi:hypothetical protein
MPKLVIVVIIIIIIIISGDGGGGGGGFEVHFKSYKFQDYVLNAANVFTSFLPLSPEVRAVAVLETFKKLSADKNNKTDRCNVPAVSIKLLVSF